MAFLLINPFAAIAQTVFTVSDSGAALRKYYQSLDVEHLWLRGHHINWETGIPDSSTTQHNIKTHCSVFVAAALKRKNIYILRPPDHSQTLLANAQYDWLRTRTAERTGWYELSGNSVADVYDSAQIYANEGFVVAAVFQNSDERKSGHIALVMPGEVSSEMLDEEGPLLIMAGHKNSENIYLKEGFEKHISQWPEPDIKFFRFGR